MPRLAAKRWRVSNAVALRRSDLRNNWVGIILKVWYRATVADQLIPTQLARSSQRHSVNSLANSCFLFSCQRMRIGARRCKESSRTAKGFVVPHSEELTFAIFAEIQGFRGNGAAWRDLAIWIEDENAV